MEAALDEERVTYPDLLKALILILHRYWSATLGTHLRTVLIFCAVQFLGSA